MPFIFIHY